MRRYLSSFSIALLLAGAAAAQPEDQQPVPRRESLFYEAATFLAGNPARVRVDVHYRIDAGFFVAVRNSDPSFRWDFRRKGEVSIELRDSTGMARARSIQQVDLGDNLSERGETDVRWYQGIASLEVPPGRYSVQLEATDQDSRRSLLEKRVTVDARLPRIREAETTTPFWIRDTIATSLTPLNFGGEILLNSSNTLLFQIPLTGSLPQAVTAEYAFTRTPKGSKTEDFTGTVSGKMFRNLSLRAYSGGDSVRYDAVEDTSLAALTVALPIPTERLRLRTYEMTLTVRLDTQTFSIKKQANVIWPGMPFSLKDVDYALEALSYIAPEEKIDSLRDGDFETRIRNLEGFWTAMDKGRANPYNEAMTEYYRRVDHAMKTFGTLRRPDGFKSDRGKIYVLYGPPTHTERELDPAAGFREIWEYQRLNKTFVFIDRARSGDYVLLQPAQ